MQRWKHWRYGWIVTLDVLKSNPVFKRFASCCWIVTLDVLKFADVPYNVGTNFCWIVTLDVLKCVI